MQGVVGNLWGVPGVNEQHRRTVARWLLNWNPAVLGYFDLLDSRWGAVPTLAVGYSQGNWVLSNALSGLLAVRVGAGTLPATINAFGLAPPNFFWPAGVTVRQYANTQDLIPYLSLGTGFTGDTSSWGSWTDMLTMGPGAVNYWHALEQYVQNSQFVRDIRTLLGLDAVVEFPTPEEAASPGAPGMVTAPLYDPRPRAQDYTDVGLSPIRGTPASVSAADHAKGGTRVDPKTLVPQPRKPPLRHG